MLENLDQITWPVVTGFLGTLFGFLMAAIRLFMLKQRSNPELDEAKKAIHDIEHKLDIVETRLTTISETDRALDQNIKDVINNTKDIFDRLEAKMEKISDLVIKIIQKQLE